jgi:holo-[acyl-carrier protein] synthase
VIVSIGVDITEVERVREVLKRTPRFRERVFTAGERAYCDAKGTAAAQHYAARFAAKEAVFKALRTGWSGGLSWHEAEVASRESGEPVLILHGLARELFAAAGATHAHLSLSHTSVHAVAQVIFERREK